MKVPGLPIWALKGCTMFEMQLSNVCIYFRYPGYWLYSRSRAQYIRNHGRDRFCKSAWFYNSPILIKVSKP